MQSEINQTPDNQTNDRSALKSKLRKGDLKKIADLANVSLTTVWRWFNKNTSDELIEKTVHAVILKNDQDLQERLKNI